MTGSWREVAARVLQNLQDSRPRPEMHECNSLSEAAELFDLRIERLALIPVLEGSLAGKKRFAKKLLLLLRSDEAPGLNTLLTIFRPGQDQTTWGICALVPYFDQIKLDFALE